MWRAAGNAAAVPAAIVINASGTPTMIQKIRRRMCICSGGFSTDSRSRLSSVGAILAVFTRGLHANAAARQCLAKKNLDFGVDTAQICRGATLDRFEDRFLSPER